MDLNSAFQQRFERLPTGLGGGGARTSQPTC